MSIRFRLYPGPFKAVADKKSKIHPKGESSVNLTETLKIYGFPKFSVASSPYRGRPWWGWMSLWYFLCARVKYESPSIGREGAG